MTFGQLRTFLEVARRRSVRAAAAALVVSEPSVSAAVAGLTREFGSPLIEREGRGIKITPAGAELARYAEQILGLADRSRRAVAEAAGGPGHLRLAAVTTAGEYVLPRLLAGFRARQPELQVSLEVGNQATALAQLRAQEVDLAVGGRAPSNSPLEGFGFQDNHLIVVARSDHPLRRKRRCDPGALSEETWLLREEGSGTRTTTEEFLASNGIQPHSILTIGSNGAIKSAAAVGLGISLLSRDAVTGELASGELTQLRVKGTPLLRSWHVLYRENAPLPACARDFLTFLTAPPTDLLPA